jgi:hypothetical protein
MKYVKKLAVLTVLLSVIFSPVPGFTKESTPKEVFSTGSEWLEKMSVREKLISLLPPALLMHRYGVSFRQKMENYIPLIDSVLDENPQLEKSDVANIFASTVYTYEPENREALKNMERDLNLRRQGYNPSFFPKLMISAPVDRDITD